MAISALVCKNVGTVMQPESMLQYDSRIDCLSAEYLSYRIYAWIMVGLWPIGCPLFLLLLLKLYGVPEITARKLREAKVRAFVIHSLAKASEIGIERTEAALAATPEDVDNGRPRRASTSRSRRLSTGRRRSLESASANEGVFANARIQSYANLEDISLPLLQLLGKAHGINSASTAVLIAELTKRMTELIDCEEVVVPRVVWDEESSNEDERRAFTRLESLIGAYEVDWWWCVT